MKQLLIFAFLALGINFVKAQIVNNGGAIVVSSNSKIVLENNYQSNNSGVLTINGEMLLKGNFINNSGTIEPATGILKFEGSALQKIEGTVSTSFPLSVQINNSIGVSLAQSSGNPVNINKLTIEPNGKLIIESGKALSVSGVLTNNAGTSGLVIQSGISGQGSLIHSTNNVQGTVQIAIPGVAEKWHMISSPVATQSIIGSFTQNGHLFSWSEIAQAWVKAFMTVGWPTWSDVNNGHNNFIPAKGYIVMYDVVPQSKDFIGNLNQGSISLPLSFQAKSKDTYQGFNMAGNPYPSSIDWKASSGWDRSKLFQDTGGGFTYWVWNGSAGNYGTFISSGSDESGTNGATRYLAPNQAFWVQASQAGNLGIDNPVRVHSTGTMLKDVTIDNNLMLSISGNANTYSDETSISLGNTNDTGGARKMFSLYSSAPSLYTVKSDNNYSINLLADMPKQPVILAFKAGVAGNYTIAASGALLTEKVVLEDLLTGTRTELNNKPTYLFTASPSDMTNRFLLHFANLGTAMPIDPSELKFSCYYANGELTIDNPFEGTSQAELFDVAGKCIDYWMLSGKGVQQHAVSYKVSGIYIIRIRNEKQISTNKFIIKK